MFAIEAPVAVRSGPASPDQQGPAGLIVALILSPLLPCRGCLRGCLRVIPFALDTIQGKIYCHRDMSRAAAAGGCSQQHLPCVTAGLLPLRCAGTVLLPPRLSP